MRRQSRRYAGRDAAQHHALGDLAAAITQRLHRVQEEPRDGCSVGLCEPAQVVHPAEPVPQPGRAAAPFQQDVLRDRRFEGWRKQVEDAFGRVSRRSPSRSDSNCGNRRCCRSNPTKASRGGESMAPPPTTAQKMPPERRTRRTCASTPGASSINISAMWHRTTSALASGKGNCCARAWNNCAAPDSRRLAASSSPTLKSTPTSASSGRRAASSDNR